MNIFKVNSELRKYTYPIVKLVICILVIAACVIVKAALPEGQGDIIVAILSILSFASLPCIYVAGVELLAVYDNRVDDKERLREVDDAECRSISAEDTFTLIGESDALTVEIKTEDGIIKFGSISDLDKQTGLPTNKRYYLGRKTAKNLEDLRLATEKYVSDGSFFAVSLGGERACDVDMDAIVEELRKTMDEDSEETEDVE